MLPFSNAAELAKLTQSHGLTARSGNSFQLNITLICLLGTSNLALAQNQPLLNEADFLADIPVVTVASRLKQHLHDTPASVTVLDRATITASGAQTLPDLLRLVPGFQVFNVNANKFGASYHGMNDEFPNQLEVMVNGRSVYLPLLSTVIWTSLGLNPEDLERVEIVRGSNAATLGSNAFMGAVNFITRHPASEATFTAAGTLGSQQTQNSHLRFSGETENIFYRISASHEANTGSARFNDSAKRQYLNTELSFAPSLMSERLPSLLERQGNFRIEQVPDQFKTIDRANPKLASERNQSWELGLLHNLTPLNGYLDLRIFHERISNAIVNVKQLDGAGMKMNNGLWRNQGAEAQLKLQPHDSFWFILNYSYLDNRAGNWDQGQQAEKYKSFPGGQLAPKHTLSALLNWQLAENTNLSSTYYFMDQVRWRKSYGTLNAQEPYQRLDLKLAKQWGIAAQKMELAAIIQNAVHGSYKSFYQDNEFDRRAFLQFRLTMD